MDNKVYAVPCSNYQYENIIKSLDDLLINNHLLDFVYPGMKVGIKVNLVSALSPDKAGTTNPLLVKRLCELLINKGAIVTIGDSPGGLFNESHLENVYKETLMTESVKVGAKLNYNFNTCLKDVNGLVVKKLDACAWLFEQDAIINFSKIKSHGMLTLSGSVKNMFGTVPGITKPEYHYRYPKYEDFSNMLIDINEFYKCQLNIMDAVIGMEGNGPTQGTPRKVGLILASKSPYGIDVAARHLINLDDVDIKTITEADNRNLCSKNYRDLEISMDLEPFVVKDYENVVAGKDMSFGNNGNVFTKFIYKIVKNVLIVRPNPNKNECIGCAKCYHVCPAKAITMKNKIPSIDKNKCIRCFCCQEFCPVGAMKVKRNLIVKIIDQKKEN